MSSPADLLPFMMSKIGHPYSQTLGRFGPKFYDCSGLVYDALKAAGINIPQSQAIASSEADWLSQHGAQTIKSANQVQKGDIVFFTGASPDPSSFGGIGHVGVATSGTQFVSAFDHADGVVVKPMAGENFVVAMRLNGAVNGNAPASSGGGGGGILSIPEDITNAFVTADKLITRLGWLVTPSHWVRIAAFFIGIILLMFAVHVFSAAASGSPLLKSNVTVPLPV